MNDMRERLIELLKSNLRDFQNDVAYWHNEHIGELADVLLANGVTIQEWISVDDRLPEMGQIVLVSGKRHATSGQFTGTRSDPRHWWWKGNTYKYVTHWMPLPQPPKGE